MASRTLDPATTALVLIDLQRGITSIATQPHSAAEVIANAAADSDVRVTKHQPGAFHATDLDLQLRRRRVDTIVIGGISTNVGVESTARAGYDHGYNIVFVEDAMAARDAEVHAFAVTRYFPTIGRVRATRDVLDALR